MQDRKGIERGTITELKGKGVLHQSLTHSLPASRCICFTIRGLPITPHRVSVAIEETRGFVALIRFV